MQSPSLQQPSSVVQTRATAQCKPRNIVLQLPCSFLLFPSVLLLVLSVVKLISSNCAQRIVAGKVGRQTNCNFAAVPSHPIVICTFVGNSRQFLPLAPRQCAVRLLCRYLLRDCFPWASAWSQQTPAKTLPVQSVQHNAVI